jgi:hypothetical protein
MNAEIKEKRKKLWKRLNNEIEKNIGKKWFSLFFSEHARLNAAIRKGITMNIDLLNLT